MSVALTHTGLRDDTTLPEIIATEVEQEKLASDIHDYVMELAKQPFAKDMIIDVRRGTDDIDANLPDIEGYEPQKRALALLIGKAIQSSPVITVTPKFDVRLVLSPKMLTPLNIPESQEATTITMINAETGIMQTGLVMPADEPPDLSYLEIPAGMMIMSQPSSGFLNTQHQFNPSLHGTAGDLYNTRGNDPQPRGDEAWVPISEMPKSALEQEALRQRALRTAQPPSANESTTAMPPNPLPWLVGAGVLAEALDGDGQDDLEHELEDPEGHKTNTIVVGVPRPGEVPGLTPQAEASGTQLNNGAEGSLPETFAATTLLSADALQPGDAMQIPYTELAATAGVAGARLRRGPIIRGPGYTEPLRRERKRVETSTPATTTEGKTAELAKFEAAELEIAAPEFDPIEAAETAEENVRDLMEGRGYIPDVEYNELQQEKAEAAVEQANEDTREQNAARDERVETEFEVAAVAETEQRIDETNREEVREANEEDRLTHGIDTGNDSEEINDVQDREQLAHKKPSSPFLPDTPEYEANRDLTPAGINQDQYRKPSGGYPNGDAPNNINPEGIAPLGQTRAEVGGVAPTSTISSANLADKGPSPAVVAHGVLAAKGAVGSSTTHLSSSLSTATITDADTQVSLPPTPATMRVTSSTASLSDAAVAAAPAVVKSSVIEVAEEVVVESVLGAVAVAALDDKPAIEPSHVQHSADQEESSDMEGMPEALLLGSMRRRKLNKNSDVAPPTSDNNRRDAGTTPNARRAPKARATAAKARPTMQNMAKAELLQKPHHPDQLPKPPGEDNQNTPT